MKHHAHAAVTIAAVVFPATVVSVLLGLSVPLAMFAGVLSWLTGVDMALKHNRRVAAGRPAETDN